jgi:hypothetical protein
VAGRPLRPAIDRSLGRPLPHQQANRTQATPKAPRGFLPQQICGISPSFPGLSPTSWTCSYALLTRPPLTLLPVRLACVKHAASVHSEPGSNSQVHQHPNLRRGQNISEKTQIKTLTRSLLLPVTPAHDIGSRPAALAAHPSPNITGPTNRPASSKRTRQTIRQTRQESKNSSRLQENRFTCE